jgi:hypothetical protein
VNRGLAWGRRRWYVIVGLVVVLCVQGWLVQGVVASAHDRQQRSAEAEASRVRIEASANEAKDLAAQVKHQNDLILSVTGPEAQARQAAGTRDILLRNAIETDCRSRRQQVRLPAPDPTRPCADQTDESVYPGVAGTPPKGP